MITQRQIDDNYETTLNALLDEQLREQTAHSLEQAAAVVARCNETVSEYEDRLRELYGR